MDHASSPMPAPGLNISRRSQMVAQNILRLITSGALPPGSKLPTETQLCDQFRVSRTTLREAIQTLRARGLLDVSPGRGSYIRQPNLQEHLETLAVDLHASATIGTPDIYRVLSHLLFQNIGAALTAPLGARQQLFRHIVMADASPQSNLALEQSWYRAFINLNPDCANCLLITTILNLACTLQRSLNSAEAHHDAIRLGRYQLRATTALVEGDEERLHQALQQWMTAAPPPQTTRAAA